MAFYDKFPYTNYQELNLDWIMQEVAKVRDNRDASDASAAAALASEQAAKASETAAAASQQAAAESEQAAAGSEAASAEYLRQIGTHTAGAVADWLEENLEPTTPPVDASLTVSGAAADAKVTGGMINAINPRVSYIWTLGRAVNSDGSISSSNYRAITNRIACETGDFAISFTPKKDAGNNDLLLYVAEYNGETFIRRTRLFEPAESVTLSENCTNIILDFGRAAGTEISISQTDIDTYFSVKFYREALLKQDYMTAGFRMRGRITDLGYTSLGECKESGAYVFTTADAESLSDMPFLWEPSGGILFTYVNGTRIWQEIKNNDACFMRYGLTGPWIIARDYICLKNSTNNTIDDSTEQLDVFIPKDHAGNSILYRMGKCVNTDKNCNVWRLMYLYSVDATGSETVMTRRGEFECAVHLAGRDDFSGGYLHGDEIDQNVIFKKDGKTVTRANTVGYCKEFVIVRNSILYDPADGTTPIAKHGVEYKFTTEGLVIRQSLKWLVSETLTDCYLAMLPMLKTYSDYYFSDIDFESVQLSGSNYNINIPNAKMITEYVNALSAKIELEEYPTGLTGGDTASITDNGGLPYNKVYFVVCSSGTSTINEVWKSKTKYSVK